MVARETSERRRKKTVRRPGGAVILSVLVELPESRFKANVKGDNAPSSSR